MACTGRKNRNVAGAELESATTITAEPNFRAAAGDAKHFVNARMIVQIVVDAVAPAVAPAVLVKQLFHDRGWIKRAAQLGRAPINDDRPMRVVGTRAVITVPKRTALS